MTGEHRVWCQAQALPSHAICHRLVTAVYILPDIGILVDLNQSRGNEPPLITLTTDRAGSRHILALTPDRAQRLGEGLLEAADRADGRQENPDDVYVRLGREERIRAAAEAVETAAHSGDWIGRATETEPVLLVPQSAITFLMDAVYDRPED
jgi:hypothetical protein